MDETKIPPEEWKREGLTIYALRYDGKADARFLWSGARNYVELNPQVTTAHIFKLRRYVRTEHDFDYFV